MKERCNELDCLYANCASDISRQMLLLREGVNDSIGAMNSAIAGVSGDSCESDISNLDRSLPYLTAEPFILEVCSGEYHSFSVCWNTGESTTSVGDSPLFLGSGPEGNYTKSDFRIACPNLSDDEFSRLWRAERQIRRLRRYLHHVAVLVEDLALMPPLPEWTDLTT